MAGTSFGLAGRCCRRQVRRRVDRRHLGQQRLGQAVATGDEIDHGGVGCAAGRPRVGCWKVAARKSPCSARGSRSSQRPEVLVSFTAVTHWSSSRHAASACARTGSVGSKVSSARLRRRLTRPMPAMGSTVRSGAYRFCAA